MKYWLTIVLGGVLFAQASCKPRQAEQRFDPGPCARGTCIELRNRDERVLFDRVDGTRISAEIHDSPLSCNFDVSWLLGEEGPMFHATVFSYVGEAFPIRGHVVELVSCTGIQHNECCSIPPFATLQRDPPAFDGVRPAADDVFIPIDGASTLDDQSYLTVKLDPPDGGAVPPVTLLRTTDRGAAEEVGTNMGEGDTFQWSGRLATLVRVFPPGSIPDSYHPWNTGWVEVRLSDAVRDDGKDAGR